MAANFQMQQGYATRRPSGLGSDVVTLAVALAIVMIDGHSRQHQITPLSPEEVQAAVRVDIDNMLPKEDGDALRPLMRNATA